jgi:hypothetical protein
MQRFHINIRNVKYIINTSPFRPWLLDLITIEIFFCREADLNNSTHTWLGMYFQPLMLNVEFPN